MPGLAEALEVVARPLRNLVRAVREATGVLTEIQEILEDQLHGEPEEDDLALVPADDCGIVAEVARLDEEKELFREWMRMKEGMSGEAVSDGIGWTERLGKKKKKPVVPGPIVVPEESDGPGPSGSEYQEEGGEEEEEDNMEE
jgi:hypothetical protein